MIPNTATATMTTTMTTNTISNTLQLWLRLWLLILFPTPISPIWNTINSSPKTRSL
jgi:hypothetical protein